MSQTETQHSAAVVAGLIEALYTSLEANQEALQMLRAGITCPPTVSEEEKKMFDAITGELDMLITTNDVLIKHIHDTVPGMKEEVDQKVADEDSSH
jgi:hypothetical protein